MKQIRKNHPERTLLSLLFLFAALSLRAQSSDAATFSLAPGDVIEARIGTLGRATLQVTLTPQKSAEFSAFTGRNLNKQVTILVGGKLRSQPFIREQISGPSMEIFVNSEEDAIATVKALLTSTVRFDQLHKWTDASGQTHYSEKAPPPSSRPPVKPVGEDRKAFQALTGSWAVIKATMNGKESHDASLVQGNWVFAGNELSLQSPQKGKARFSLTMDPDAKAKAFHLTALEPADAGFGWMLFSREGENLKIAFHDNLQGRPDSFEPRDPDSKPELIVLTLSRKK